MEPTLFIPRVDDYFGTYNQNEPWQQPGAVRAVDFIAARSAISVTLEPDAAGVTRLILLELPHSAVLRLRFDPRATSLEGYPEENTRTIVMDEMSHLRDLLGSPAVQVTPPGTPGASPDSWQVTVAVAAEPPLPTLRLFIKQAAYALTVQRPDGAGGWLTALQDAPPGIQFRPVVEYVSQGNHHREYQVLRRTRKPVTAQYVGFGEKAGRSIIKNGKRLTYVNFDNWAMSSWYGNGPFEDREPLYNSNPFYLEYHGADPRLTLYGVLVDNTAPLYMDIAQASPDIIQIGTLYDDLDLYHFFGSDTKAILALLTEFVGRARLKPRYVLGYHQGCYGDATRPALEHVAERYRTYHIPIDGLHIDIDFQDRFCTFTIDERSNAFPDAAGMLSGLAQCGYKCSTNITPFIRDDVAGNPIYQDGAVQNVFVTEERSTAGPNQNPAPHDRFYRGGVPYEGGLRGVYPDLGQRRVRDWFGKQYQLLLSKGLKMVWQDMTTPCMLDNSSFTDWHSFPLNVLLTNDARKMYQTGGDEEALTIRTPSVLARNLYAYNLVKATYHGLNHSPERGEERNFIIARGGFTGMHRFAALWTGDNIAEWPYLRLNVLESLAGGISGQPMTGADIGGFGDPNQGEWADPELIIRWTIAGAFLPWFRSHYTKKGKSARRFQEPWAYYEKRHEITDGYAWQYELTLIACRHYINLRYRLMQLFYDLMFENTLNGLPMMRPLFVNDDHDPHLFADKSNFLNDEWFVGKDLLVAPILDKENDASRWGTREVYLPVGSDWYCYMHNVRPLAAAVDGGTQFDYNARLSLDPGHLDFLCPIYVRAGAILPTVELEQYVGQMTRNGRPANPITLNFYPAPAAVSGMVSTYNLYEDDGMSRRSAFRPEGDNEEIERTGTDPLAANEHRHTEVRQTFVLANQKRIELIRQHDGYSPEPGYMFLAILHDPGEVGAGLGGSPLASLLRDGTALPPLSGAEPDQLANQLAASNVSAWYYHPGLRISFLKVVDAQPHETFTLKYA